MNLGQFPVTMFIILAALSFTVEFCVQIPDSSFFCCHEVVLLILARYNAQCQMPHRQRLVWKLSQRTLRYLRPTDKLTSIMPTIDEHGQLQMPTRIR
jgi:cyclin G2